MPYNRYANLFLAPHLVRSFQAGCINFVGTTLSREYCIVCVFEEEASVSAVMVSQNEEQLRLDDGTGALSATNVSTGPTELSPSHDISAQDQDDAGSAASPSLAIINQGQLAVGEDAPSRFVSIFRPYFIWERKI